MKLTSTISNLQYLSAGIVFNNFNKILRYNHIYMYIYIYIYVYIYVNFVCQVLMSKYIYKKLRHLFTKKLYFGFFQTFKDSIK